MYAGIWFVNISFRISVALEVSLVYNFLFFFLPLSGFHFEVILLSWTETLIKGEFFLFVFHFSCL